MVRHCLWKMCATPDACINETALFISTTVVPQSKSTELSSSSAAFVPYKGNLPSCYFIMTCDIFGTRKTNILALCYLYITYKPAYSGPLESLNTLNTLDQISTEEVIREFKIRRLRTTATDKHATTHDQNHVTVHFSRVALRLR